MNLLVGILESFLGKVRKHNEDTGQSSFDCPACAADKGLFFGDGRGNLEINYEKGVFKCWSCQDINRMHGPIIKLLNRYATDTNKRDYLLIKPESNYIKDDDYEDIILKLPDSFKYLAKSSYKDYGYYGAINYLRERGITDEIINDFNIGFCSHGKFYNRIIIPSYDVNNNLTYFVARWFPKGKTLLKYLNPEVKKERIIFNEGKINWDATIFLVEGATDHIVVPNSIPLLGKFISEKLLNQLYDNANGYIVVLLDEDATKSALKLCQQLNFGILRDRILICIPPPNLDPSKVYEKYGNKGIINMLRTSRKPTTNEIY